MNRSSHPLWLSDAREFRPPLDESAPIWIRHGEVRAGLILPHPEFHPCCEFSILLRGRLRITAGGEETQRGPGDIFLVPPGLPHDNRIIQYPYRFCAVFFQPFLLTEMMPKRDGQILLNRFLTRQPLSSRLPRLPSRLRTRLRAGFEDMIREAEAKDFGYEIRLRGILLDLLVRLHRWEISSGHPFPIATEHTNWQIVCATLAYLREHFAEVIYARDLARAVGASPSRLRAFFHELLGTTWGHCLNAIRIRQAAALLSHSPQTISEIAFACGFQTLSHFNMHFAAIMGQTPTRYRRRKS